MAINSKNKYPADKTGTKYSEFKNTKRRAAGKVRTGGDNRQSSGDAMKNAGQTS